ncbi:MAG: hypothetical protein WD825_10175 [Gemmatimonadaceae bacterium]
MGLFASPAAGQMLPYTVTIVDWSPGALERQRRAYRTESARREVLFCIEAWRVHDSTSAFQRIVVERTRRETSGQAHGVANAGRLCAAANGERLPMLHTHSDGNCQLSPNDLLMIAARAAPFDGIQCGENHFVWAFAWQIKAIANSVYLREGDQPVP